MELVQYLLICLNFTILIYKFKYTFFIEMVEETYQRHNTFPLYSVSIPRKSLV